MLSKSFADNQFTFLFAKLDIGLQVVGPISSAIHSLFTLLPPYLFYFINMNKLTNELSPQKRSS